MAIISVTGRRVTTFRFVASIGTLWISLSVPVITWGQDTVAERLIERLKRDASAASLPEDILAVIGKYTQYPAQKALAVGFDDGRWTFGVSYSAPAQIHSAELALERCQNASFKKRVPMHKCRVYILGDKIPDEPLDAAGLAPLKVLSGEAMPNDSDDSQAGALPPAMESSSTDQSNVATNSLAASQTSEADRNVGGVTKAQIISMARTGQYEFFSNVDPMDRNGYAIVQMLRREYGVLVPYQRQAKGSAPIDEDKTPQIGYSQWVICASWFKYVNAYPLGEMVKAAQSNRAFKSRKLNQLDRDCRSNSGEPLPVVRAFRAFFAEVEVAIQQHTGDERTRRAAEEEAKKQAKQAAEREKQARKEKERRDEEEKALLARAKQQERIDALRSGKQSIQSADDARIARNASGTMEHISRPLLTPDNRYYYWGGILERSEGGYYVAKFGQNYFAFEKKLIGTKVFNEGNFKINGWVYVVGQYTANIEYRTVLGVPKIMPLLTADFIEPR